VFPDGERIDAALARLEYTLEGFRISQ
jgi:hypothetical protein